jgi:hypothetical protein
MIVPTRMSILSRSASEIEGFIAAGTKLDAVIVSLPQQHHCGGLDLECIGEKGTGGRGG